MGKINISTGRRSDGRHTKKFKEKITMASKENKLLQRAHEARGFHLGVHEIMADANPSAFEQYQTFVESAYTNDGQIDRKTKEFLHIAVNIALATDKAQIIAHMKAANKAGASEEELFEICNLMFVLAGSTALLRAMEAWRLTFREDLPCAYDLITEAP
jgi:alkylhydroperoxidase/carboxymuconolactone decarboxylase family protein YurZ